MAPTSAFSAGLLPSSPGSSAGGFGSDDGGGPGADDLSLPSLADSFHSDLERDRLPSGSAGGGVSVGLGDAWGSIEGARPDAADGDDDGWDRHGTPATIRKSRSRPNHRSSSASPTPSSMTPLAAAGSVTYPSSYVDLDTPQADINRHVRKPTGAPMDRADGSSLSNASSASSRAFSDLTDVSAMDGGGDDLFAQSPPRAGPSASLLGASINGGKPRAGRMSIAGGELGGSRMGQSLTLREQEKALDQKDREIFDLKLKIHFLTLRLEQQSPQTHSALEDENMQLKVAYGRLKAECKKNKKYSLECVKVIEELKRELENARASGHSAGAGGLAAARAARERESELSDKVREEKERRRALEEEVERLRERADKEARQLRDSEDEIQRLQKANAELEQENEAVHDHAEAAKDELRQAQEELHRRADEDESRTRGGASDAEAEELRRRAEELEDDLEVAQGQLEAQKTAIETLKDEREELLDERDDLRMQLDRAGVGAAGALNRSMAPGDNEESERERNELRDRLAAAGVELEKKESILEEKERALQEAYAELDGADQHWADEVKVIKSQNEELKDVLQECEKENEALRDEVSELRHEMAELQAKLAELEDLNTELADRLEEHMSIQQNEKTEREAELLANNEEIQVLAARVQELENELEGHIAKERELERELDAQDAQMEDTHSLHDQVVVALKEKHAQTKGDLDELVELYEAAQKDVELKKSQVKELSALAADLEGQRRTDGSLKRRLTEEREELASKLRKVEDEKAREASSWKRELEDSEAHWRRQLQDKDSVISRLTLDVERAQTRLLEREQDLQAMQDGTRRLGETHSEDRFALELEVERYRRDLEHAEDDLERTRKDLERKEAALGQREDALAGLHAEIRDVEAKLSAERQSRLNISDKLDSAQRGFRNAEQEANGLRERVEDLEQRLTDDQRALLTTRTQSETQRKESSQLLQTVFQNLNKILGTEDRATPANFGVFRDTLLSRLRTLGQLQHNFDKKVKACEAAFSERLTGMKRQLDAKWRQLDHFEASVRKVELVKTQWRNKLAQKQGELDSLQAKHADLVGQLSGVKGMTRSESTADAKASATRIATLERRLNNALNQITTYDEKLGSARSKMTAAESRWDVRVREYESRLKAAEEKVKAEKQGGKERAAQLDMQVEDLKKQVEMAKRRAEKLQDLVPRTSARVSP